MRKPTNRRVADTGRGSWQPGDLKPTARSTSSPGWLLCDGTAVSRAGYPALFAAIGTTFGTGDGSTTFNVPDFRSRFPIGAGQGSGLTLRTFGTTGGAESVTSGASSNNDTAQGGVTTTYALNSHTHTVATVPPFLTINFLVKT